MLPIVIVRLLLIWLAGLAGRISGLAIAPTQDVPVALAEHHYWRFPREPLEASTRNIAPVIPLENDTKLQSRNSEPDRSNKWWKFHEKGLQKWKALNEKLHKSPLPPDVPTLTPDQLRQGGWDIGDACGSTPSESDLAVLLGADPNSSDDLCFDMPAKDKNYQGDEDSDGIVFQNKYCPGYGGLEVVKAYKDTQDKTGETRTARTSWSNVTWALWSSLCESEDQVADLRWAAGKNIANTDTLDIISEMRDDIEPKITDRPGAGKYQVYSLKPGSPSSKRADQTDPDFFALLASPNGNGIYYILNDHMDKLRKIITEIRVYVQVSWDEDEEEYDDEDLPELVFLFSK